MANGDEMNGGVPTPPTAAPPPPPMGAMNKGVTGADPTNTAAPTASSPSDPENQLMAEATRLGGPLGGIAMGAATGAAHHTEQQNQPQSDPNATVYYKLSSGRVASLPTASVHALMQQDAGAKPLPSPKDGEALVQLSDGRVATLPSTSFDALRKQDANFKVIAGGPPQESDQENVGNILGEQWLSPTSQNEANQKEKGISAAETAGILGGPLAPALAETMGAGLGTSATIGAAQGAVQGTANAASNYNSDNPFRQEMTKAAKEIAATTAAGAAGGAILHGAGKVVGAIADKYRGIVNPSVAEAAGGLPSEVTEAHFTPIADSEIPKLAGGKTPFVGDQPFDRSTISAMPQAKALNTDAINLLQNYAGDTIPAGSHEMNTAMRAITPLTENINRLGLEMNQAIQSAPEFAQSTIEDDIGTKLLDDIQTMKENLPDGPNSKQAEIITKQMGASHDALTSTDPQEILMARRKLGDQIDKAWKEASTNPDTNKEVQIAARKTIYGALTDKLHQIEGVAKADADFQPHLDLRNWFDKVLPEGVAYDPVLADQLQSSEFQKGLKINAIKAHNDRISNNRAIASRALGYTIGGGLLADVAKHTLLSK